MKRTGKERGLLYPESVIDLALPRHTHPLSLLQLSVKTRLLVVPPSNLSNCIMIEYMYRIQDFFAGSLQEPFFACI